MAIQGKLAAALLISFANHYWMYEFQSGGTESEKVYYGEVVDKKGEEVTLNVTPCESKKTPQTISPYEILSSQETSCGDDGRKYLKVAVRERKAKPPKPPKPPDPPSSPEKPSKPDKPANDTPQDSPPQTYLGVRGSHNEA
jgi:hypothetical protein